jgi:hypothetical protein
MELYFCDRCNTSIPQRDVEAGIAILSAGRAFCVACKRIITGEEYPREVLFCDFCNVSVALADVREERAVFREGRLYCPKCKYLIADRGSTGGSTETSPSVGPLTSGTTLTGAVSTAAPGSTSSARPEASASATGRGAWASWILVLLLGTAAGLVSYRFAPDLGRWFSGKPDGASPGVDRAEPTPSNPPPADSRSAARSLEIDLQPHFRRIEDEVDGLRRAVSKYRSVDRAEFESRLDVLRGEAIRLSEADRERWEILRRDLDALRSVVAGLERRRIEAPSDEPAEATQEESAPSEEEEIGQQTRTEEPVLPVGSRSALDHHLERLRSPDAGVRFSAVVELGRLAEESAIPALGEVAMNDGDNYVRDFAVRVLGNMGVAAVIPYLIRALRDSDALVASSANEGLVRITKRSFGFDRKATSEQRQDAIRKWEDWWEKNRETFK